MRNSRFCMGQSACVEICSGEARSPHATHKNVLVLEFADSMNYYFIFIINSDCAPVCAEAPLSHGGTAWWYVAHASGFALPSVSPNSPVPPVPCFILISTRKQ